MGFTTNYANTILTNLVKGVYCALTTAAPDAGSTGSTIVEPSTANGYSRVLISTASGDFSASGRILTNGAYIYFPEATASWGTITHLCFCGAEKSGDLRYFGALNSPVAVAANTVPLFRPQAISISLDAD